MRQRIMQAATEEMRARGIKFTMADLAHRLGVSKRLLYEYFASKEELIGAIVDFTLQEIREQRTAIFRDPNLTFSEKLKQLLTPKKHLLPDDGRIAEEIKRCLPMEYEKFDRFNDQEWERMDIFLREGIQKGHLRPVCLPVVKKILDGTRKEIVNYQFLVHNSISLGEAFTYMVDVLLNGMLAQKNDITE
ncbi:MAG TPA: TetR/AcrR family transcriptional regulator [Methylomusa anaerophila]|uniref:Transcriptional regulator BetI n=1 Tax=Methylomusa anaerophila TaxID=1930071 RepID=A0A348AG91_9FIRM|nr:TetR/AcrR family transcriptional regulator [Methylomusa anaerophila]BBB90089.1 transcriptional regulator BetI [Methylomusa anaerophila]HML88186.1 TetR/AcrR family transcriptional regulator [Methylomusa anaerophila]